MTDRRSTDDRSIEHRSIEHRSTEDRSTEQRSIGRLLVAAVLGLVMVLLLAVVVVLGVEQHHRSQLAAVQRGGGPALTQARDAAQALFSYDHSRLDADLAAALPLTTAPYTDTYRSALQRLVWPAARADGTVVVATVRQVGATAATSSDRLVALVLIDLTTRHRDAYAGPGEPTTVAPGQLRMTLVQRHGRWVVSDVATL